MVMKESSWFWKLTETHLLQINFICMLKIIVVDEGNEIDPLLVIYLQRIPNFEMEITIFFSVVLSFMLLIIHVRLISSYLPLFETAPACSLSLLSWSKYFHAGHRLIFYTVQSRKQRNIYPTRAKIFPKSRNVIMYSELTSELSFCSDASRSSIVST